MLCSDLVLELIWIRKQTFSGAAVRTPDDDYIAWLDEGGTPTQYYENNWRKGYYILHITLLTQCRTFPTLSDLHHSYCS